MDSNITQLTINQLPTNVSPTSKSNNISAISPKNYQQQPHDLTSALLNRLFPEQNREEKLVRQTRVLLGNLIQNYSTDQIEEIIIQIQYLSETWLDTYERKVFNGMTLHELLNTG